MDNFSTGFIKKEIGGTTLSKSKDKIRVSFKDSFAAENVTGSCTVITWGKPQRTILVDCGLIQGEQTLLKEYQANNAKFKSFKASEVEYVFVTHAHSDHQARIPLLYKRGFRGQVIVPEHSKEIIKTLQLDSAKIMAKDALDLTKRAKKFMEPIYENEHVYGVYPLMKEYPFNQKIKLDDEITFELIPSGHTLGSAQIILYIKNGNTTKKLAFTGDLGNQCAELKYANKFEPIQNANLLVGECTYSNKERSMKAKDRKKDIEKIRTVVADVTDNGKGSILFPTFSFMRTQQILTILYDMYKDDENFIFDVVVGSPLTCKINKIFSEELEGEDLRKWEEVLSWNKLKLIDNFDEVEEILKSKKQTIYLCSAGMLNAGFSVIVAQYLLPSSYNYLVMVGYSVEGSLAWKLKQKKQRTISINGKQVANRAGIINLSSFSSHIMYCDLMRYYSGAMGTGLYGKIALNHGNFKDKCEFGKELQEEISKRNRTDKVIIVNKSTEILL